MAAVYESIMAKLKETEQNYNVKIPIAIESGSRGWGFASPDSDYDCRFIYVHEKDWYISVLEKKDFIEYAADAIFDINGWDIKKAVQHILKSNAVMHEWLKSNEIYIKNEAVWQELNTLSEQFFNPLAVSYHYLSIAINKQNEITKASEAKLKKYFYVLRPLANLCFIENYGKIPFMEYDKNLSAIDIGGAEKKVLLEINKLKEIKADADESYLIPENRILLDYFSREIDRHSARLKSVTFTKNRDYGQADAAFKKIIEMMW